MFIRTRITLARSASGVSEAGFTLIEAMVALTIGLILATLLTVMFAANGKYRNDLDRSSRLIENGSYAMERITGALRLAGYYNELDLSNTKLTLPKRKPDPCAVRLSVTSSADSLTQMALNPATTPATVVGDSPLWLGVQGYDAPNATTAPDLSATSCGTYMTLANLQPGSDVVAIRHSDPCVAGPPADVVAGCDAATTLPAGTVYLQASGCAPDGSHTGFDGTTLLAGWELNSVSAAKGTTDVCAAADHDWCALATDTALLTLNKIDCNTGSAHQADYHRYLVDIFFIDKNDNASDGIPTLKLLQLGASGGVPSFSVTSLAEGVQSIQLEYGLDTSVTPDGAADVYTANPDTYNGCGGPANACSPQNWANAVTVKVHLLGRNTEASPVGYTNDKSYTLGLKADGSANTFGPYNDGFKRHVYEATVRLYSQGGRREQVL